MNIQLTISLLVSDRMETLGKCLNSLKPFLRELDSELIAVFTGKNEETLELLQQYTSHIIPFSWCDDFSKARNAGLKEARGEWFLYLDDDEWFEDTAEIIQFFKSGEYRSYQSAFYVQHNYMDFEGKSYSDTDVGRMCRLTSKTRFIFPIHENLEPLEEPIKKFTAFVHHFGYARKEKSVPKNAKTSRNLPLLLDMLEKEPDSPQCYMQIAQEYRSIGEYTHAVEYCRKGLELAQKEKRIYNYELWLQVNLPLLIFYTGDLELAIKEAERLLRSTRTMEMATIYLCVTLVASCRDLREYRKGMKYVHLYREKLVYLRQHPDDALRQRSAGITLDKIACEEVSVYVDGLFFAAENVDKQSIRSILSWLPWEDEDRIALLYPRLEEWKKKYLALSETIFQGYAGLHTDNLYVCLQKALFSERQGDTQKTESLWTICAGNCPAGFQWELIEMAVRNGFTLTPLLEHMSPEMWSEYATAVTSRKETPALEKFYQNMVPLIAEYSFYSRNLEQCFLERLLTQELLESSRSTKLLKQYCESVIADAEALYKEEVLKNPETYALPTSYRFAVTARKGLSLIQDGRLTDSIPFLTEAVQIYPKMSVAVSQLTRYLEEQMKNPPKAVSEEFVALGGQIKRVLTGLMEKGQWKEAYGVIAQLVPLLPDDLEVLRMKQEILRQGV